MAIAEAPKRRTGEVVREPLRLERYFTKDGTHPYDEITWERRDAVIPVAHAHATHDAIPGSVLRLLPDAGHFLPIEEPRWFTDVLLEFLDSTAPAELEHLDLRRSLLERA